MQFCQHRLLCNIKWCHPIGGLRTGTYRRLCQVDRATLEYQSVSAPITSQSGNAQSPLPSCMCAWGGEKLGEPSSYLVNLCMGKYCLGTTPHHVCVRNQHAHLSSCQQEFLLAADWSVAIGWLLVAQCTAKSPFGGRFLTLQKYKFLLLWRVELREDASLLCCMLASLSKEAGGHSLSSNNIEPLPITCSGQINTSLITC